jgi:hypothetical protein
MPLFLQLSSSLGQNPRHFGVGRCVLQKFTHPAYISLQLFSALTEPDEPTAVVITMAAKITFRILYGIFELRLVTRACGFVINPILFSSIQELICNSIQDKNLWLSRGS